MHDRGIEGAKEFAGGVTLEGPADLCVGFASGSAGSNVRVGAWAHPPAGQHDVVQRPIEVPVAATIESVPVGAAATGRHRADSRQGREGCLVAASAPM
jgi:hypothetical protein